MGGHCSGSPDRATPCSTATPHTTLKRLQFPLNGSNIAQSEAKSCDILANSVSCKCCQSSISFFCLCSFCLWIQFMTKSIKTDWRKTLSLSGKLCCKVLSVVKGKRIENMLQSDQLQMVPLICFTCNGTLEQVAWVVHFSDRLWLRIFHFQRIICARQPEGRIRDVDALGQFWPRFWLIEYTA